MKIRRKHIESLATNLLGQFAISNPPVDVRKIIEGSRIRIVEKSLGTVSSSAAIVDGHDRIIVLNHEEVDRRKRFTLAHELGHLLLHETEGLNIDEKPVLSLYYRDDLAKSGTDWKEIEANLFAACLLMPQSFLEKELKLHRAVGIDDGIVQNLADLFDVSATAMAIRLGALGAT